VIQLQDVMDTWNWDTPPPHAVPAICHVSEQTQGVLLSVQVELLPAQHLQQASEIHGPLQLYMLQLDKTVH